MSNIYHILYHPPSLDEEDSYIEVELLAKRLLESGRFRVDIDYNTLNFIRFSIPYEKIEVIFSKRELYDPALLPKTRHFMHRALQRKYPLLENRTLKVQEAIEQLRSNLNKYQPVKDDIEMKLARIVVQSTHPVVVMLMLCENVEVFVSYAYAIGDLLGIESWHAQQHNSGMQSTDGKNAAIYIAAGGDPLGDSEKGATYGNGLPALARMMIIGAQELGHYSDILRNKQGRQITRHSADFNGTKATEKARLARKADMALVKKLEQDLKMLGLMELYELEREEKFYRKINRKGRQLWVIQWKIHRYKKHFIKRCIEKKHFFLTQIRPIDGPLATFLLTVFADMKFNLEPKADAYARNDPVEEEAIACIEALARVPQQVIKWGEHLTQLMMKNLYTLYYNEVIPSCIEAYENISGNPYHFTFTKKTMPFYRKVIRWIKKMKGRRTRLFLHWC